MRNDRCLARKTIPENGHYRRYNPVERQEQLRKVIVAKLKSTSKARFTEKAPLAAAQKNGTKKKEAPQTLRTALLFNSRPVRVHGLKTLP